MIKKSLLYIFIFSLCSNFSIFAFKYRLTSLATLTTAQRSLSNRVKKKFIESTGGQSEQTRTDNSSILDFTIPVITMGCIGFIMAALKDKNDAQKQKELYESLERILYEEYEDDFRERYKCSVKERFD